MYRWKSKLYGGVNRDLDQVSFVQKLDKPIDTFVWISLYPLDSEIGVSPNTYPAFELLGPGVQLCCIWYVYDSLIVK